MQEDIIKNLEGMDPVRRTQMLSVMKEMGSPPESLFNLLERLEIPWEKRSVGGEACIIIRWRQFMAGEQRNQAQGPILKRLMQKSTGTVSSEAKEAEVVFDDEMEV